MSETTKNPVDIAEESVVETSAYDVNAVVKVTKNDDGYYCTINDAEPVGPLKIVEDGRTICLPKNPANRQYIATKKVNAALAEEGVEAYIVEVRTTAPRKIDGTSTKLPNAKLISYLSEELQEEYKAIIARAIAARDTEREANKKKPQTQREKIETKIAKLQAELDALMAETTDGGNN